MNVVLQIGDVLVLITAAIATTSVILHARVRPPWWTSAIGRHLMAYMAAMAAVLILAAIRIIAGASLEVPWFALLRTVVFMTVPVVMGWRLLIQVQLSRWTRDVLPRDDAPRRAAPETPADGINPEVPR